ncbi:MAG TPA: hypothetical protein VHA82_08270 [Ramlibacter sp.]|uniref:hypothetical protein n=1 Tax=Ramlibacter sp. TaxID=1917967 RepID=UPI002BC7DE9B|nr:hypothetical protein [Ramlibacter sp.]HVZ43791.1 hypothetical protein [Ramlibacter sp.]
MKKTLISLWLAAGAAAMSLPAHAQSEASMALSTLSALPVASVMVAGSTVVAVPVMLSTAGTVLVVKSVEVSARGTICVLERASDGTRVSIEFLGRSAQTASLAAGTLVTVSVIGAGTILSAAGEAIAFIPNALGQALLFNERVTY